MLCEKELNSSASFMVPNNPSRTYGSTIITFSKKKKTTQSLGRLVLEHTENQPKAKSLGPVPSARNAQADLGRFFSHMHRVSLINILFHSRLLHITSYF